ncbi:MFS transporter [Alicyclobacillus sp. ALC3]|uniref:MFS transporter n=1 Tax=Alicyclobacillus sp. ALC3 TaxID=2796143 RepID=UPI002379B785|nr:MFS transporter [Alicyclobacillus sp. ALC3]WDL98893.1 MFS transporter [Alicyclobacillus sp. ALC3]
MREQSIRLGLRPNLVQFVLLAVNNAFVGTMVGIERTVVPILGQKTFHLNSLAVLLAFIASFGLVKGPLNLLAGRLADRWGRKPVLIAGWLFGLPVPIMIILAPSWAWIVIANLLLGANQGFAWSMTVTSKMDLVGPKRRGLALGVNEFSGYIGVAIISTVAGYLASAYSPRPIPFIMSEVIAVCGGLTALIFIKETLPFTKLEIPVKASNEATPSLGQVFTWVSFKNRTLFACSQAGLINKLSDTAIWGLVPIQMARGHFTVAQIGLIGGIYAFSWGILQLGSGIWSDHVGRKLPIVFGQILNAMGIFLVLVAHSLAMWVIVALLMGLGTALVYPVLLSAVGDASNPAWRGSALGVYRMWRDGGYAVGGVLLGFGADWLGMQDIFLILAAVVLLSGIVVMVLMSETRTSVNKS